MTFTLFTRDAGLPITAFVSSRARRGRAAGLAAVVAGVAAALGVVAPLVAAGPASAQGTEVSIVGQAYVPVIVSIVSGEAVTWINNDAETHSVNLGDVFGDQLLAPGATYAVTFPNVGEYPYFCSLHGHAGKVVVNATADTTAPPPPTTPPKPPPTRPPTTKAPPTVTTPTTPPSTSAAVPTVKSTTAIAASPAGPTPSTSPTSDPTTSAVDSSDPTSTEESLPPRIRVTDSSDSGPGIPTGLLAGGAVAGAGAGIGGGVVMRKRAARHKAPAT